LHILTAEAARLKSQQVLAKKTNAAQSSRAAEGCAHGRAIDNYIDENGNGTKLFYWLECGTVIEPPPVASQI
jgi:hypothetical protein